MTLPEDVLAEIAEFPAALRALLEAELAAGNEVAEVIRGHPVPPAGVGIRLARPLSVPPTPAMAGAQPCRFPAWGGSSSSDPEIATAVVRHAPDLLDESERVAVIVRGLERGTTYGGLTQTLLEVEDFHPAPVIEALLHGAVRREGDVAVHFAAMLMFLHGRAETSFDWDQRPFFLTFKTRNRADREAVFRELCRKIGVDARRYLQPG